MFWLSIPPHKRAALNAEKPAFLLAWLLGRDITPHSRPGSCHPPGRE